MVFLLPFLHTPLPVNFQKKLSYWQYRFHLCVLLWFSEDEDVDSFSDEDEDESSINAVKCRWKRCGAVLQSKANALRHMQVAHVREMVGSSFAFVG